MRIFGWFFTSALACGTWAASAQDIQEAYNLSNLTVQGTARSMGFGGALGSVGGDFSSISVNPAGLGVYRSSEFSLTPSLKINGTSSSYLNNTTADNNTRFSINNFGLVLTNAARGKRYEHRNWKAFSFAVGMNRVADFNRNYTYSGNNYSNSATQAFASDANLNPGNVNTSGTLGYMGYQTYLVDTLGGQYVSAVPVANGTQQTKTVQERGSINEYLIALGGNYKEKLMLGASIGIPVVDYTRNTTYSEVGLSGSAANPFDFNSFSYANSLHIYGSGVNVKLGAIYKITDFLRVGASFHSPTFYNLNDVSDPSITATSGGYLTTLANYLPSPNNLPENQFNYSFTTPWKGVASATFILKNLGFITADYEYVDYSTMRYLYPAGIDDASGVSFQQEEADMNQQIKQTYKASSNFRLGAEIKLTKYFMVRAGAGYYGNPYKNSAYSADRLDLSAGLGFRTAHFFTDFGVVNTQYKLQESPYSIAGVTNVPVASTSYTLNNVALTVGVKF